MRTLSFSFSALSIAFLAQTHSQLNVHCYSVSHIALCFYGYRHGGVEYRGCNDITTGLCFVCYSHFFCFLFFFTLIALSYKASECTWVPGVDCCRITYGKRESVKCMCIYKYSTMHIFWEGFSLISLQSHFHLNVPHGTSAIATKKNWITAFLLSLLPDFRSC